MSRLVIAESVVEHQAADLRSAAAQKAATSSAGSPRTPSSSGAIRSRRKAASIDARSNGGQQDLRVGHDLDILAAVADQQHRSEHRVGAGADHQFALALGHAGDDHR